MRLQCRCAAPVIGWRLFLTMSLAHRFHIWPTIHEPKDSVQPASRASVPCHLRNHENPVDGAQPGGEEVGVLWAYDRMGAPPRF